MNQLDQLITTFDLGLRTVFASPHAGRPYPGTGPEADMGEAERAQAAALMRVNHVGEVCAQALYAGQALTTKNETVRAELEQAAREETDHLAWCEQRINELGGRKSLLNPLWFGGAFGSVSLPGCWATNGTSAFSPKPNARSKRISTATCSNCRKPTPRAAPSSSR